jgi:hypothetical protein
MKKKWIWMAPLAMIAFALFITLGGAVVQHLWNWLLPDLFGWRPLTFWQALGLLALCRILVGGFGMSGSGGSSRSRQRMFERWEKMTPEEREKYKQSFRGRWGRCETPPPEKE